MAFKLQASKRITKKRRLKLVKELHLQRNSGILKNWFAQKWKHCHYFLTLMSFQTCLNSLSSLEHKRGRFWRMAKSTVQCQRAIKLHKRKQTKKRACNSTSSDATWQLSQKSFPFGFKTATPQGRWLIMTSRDSSPVLSQRTGVRRWGDYQSAHLQHQNHSYNSCLWRSANQQTNSWNHISQI